MSHIPPQTEEEWMTQVLNIHGTMFERRCQHDVRSSPNWRLRSSRYPVEFPPSYSPLVSQTQNSELDLWGECESPGIKIELLAECKKNNPDFTDWVFFPETHPMHPLLRTLCFRPTNGKPAWSVQSQTMPLICPPLNIPIADDGRETKGNYQTKWAQIQNGNTKQPSRDFTKTSNTSITDAANQIAIATQALFFEEMRNREAAAREDQSQPGFRQVFLPIIVTTANLWTCLFQAEKVDNTIGEIPFSEVLYQKHRYLFYVHAIPPILQYHPSNNRMGYKTRAEMEELARLPILIVQSIAFPELLVYLSQMTKENYYDRLTLPTLG